VMSLFLGFGLSVKFNVQSICLLRQLCCSLDQPLCEYIVLEHVESRLILSRTFILFDSMCDFVLTIFWSIFVVRTSSIPNLEWPGEPGLKPLYLVSYRMAIDELAVLFCAVELKQGVHTPSLPKADLYNSQWQSIAFAYVLRIFSVGLKSVERREREKSFRTLWHNLYLELYLRYEFGSRSRR
jgi:hypothetical protein